MFKSSQVPSTTSTVRPSMLGGMWTAPGEHATERPQLAARPARTWPAGPRRGRGNRGQPQAAQGRRAAAPPAYPRAASGWTGALSPNLRRGRQT